LCNIVFTPRRLIAPTFEIIEAMDGRHSTDDSQKIAFSIPCGRSYIEWASTMLNFYSNGVYGLIVNELDKCAELAWTYMTGSSNLPSISIRSLIVNHLDVNEKGAFVISPFYSVEVIRLHDESVPVQSVIDKAAFIDQDIEHIPLPCFFVKLHVLFSLYCKKFYHVASYEENVELCNIDFKIYERTFFIPFWKRDDFVNNPLQEVETRVKCSPSIEYLSSVGEYSPDLMQLIDTHMARANIGSDLLDETAVIVNGIHTTIADRNYLQKSGGIFTEKRVD
jgi:hypothetical protein